MIGFMILHMTIQRMISTTFKVMLDRDFYDLETCRMFLESYKIPFEKLFTLNQQKMIIKNLNLLLMNKHTPNVLYDVLDLLGYKNIDKFLWCVFADNCSNDNVNDKSYVTLFQLCKDLFKDLKNMCDKVIEPSHKYKQWKNMYWETKVRVCSDVVNTFNKESKIVVFDDLVQSFMNMLKKKEGSQISNDSVSINKENSTLWFNVNNVNYVIEVFDLQKCNCRVITPDLFEFRFSTDFNIWFVRFK